MSDLITIEGHVMSVAETWPPQVRVRTAGGEIWDVTPAPSISPEALGRLRVGQYLVLRGRPQERLALLALEWQAR